MSRVISGRDAMYLANDDHYFRVARSALSCIELAMAMTDLRAEQIQRVMDLACGHGRVMRALRARFPDAEIVGCDLDPDGVEFCARTFGAVPVVADEDPRRIALDGRFELVWCGSLLTHVQLTTFESLLEFIGDSLSERGVAVVTTHGRGVAARIRRGVDYGLGQLPAERLALEADWDGFAYAAYQHTANYGMSLCTPAWLLGLVTRTLPGLRVVAFMEAAWDGHQDVLVLARAP